MPTSGRRTRLAWVLVASSVLAAVGIWIRGQLTPDAGLEVRRALASGRFADAETPLRRWIEARPASSEAYYYKGRVAIALGDLSEATASLKKAAELGCPRDQLVFLRALIAAKLDRHAEAEPDLSRAFIEAQTPDPQLDEALARIYLETYNFPRASTVLDRWTRDFPDDPRPFVWRAEIDRRSSADPSVTMNDYREALKRDPAHAKARLGLADELRKAHQNAAAATEYSVYLARNPDDLSALLGAGQNLLEKGDEAEALRLLERALALDPKNATVLNELAEVSLRRGDFAAALKLLDRAIEQSPYELAIRHRRGLALVRLGRLDEAKQEQAAASKLRAELAALNRARERLLKDPHDRGSQLELARWMFGHGQDLEGARWAERLLKERPGDVDASRLLADYNERRGNLGLANYYRLHASADVGKGTTPLPRSSGQPTSKPEATGPSRGGP